MSLKTIEIPIFCVKITMINSVEDTKAFINEHSAVKDPTVNDIAMWRGFCHSVTDTAGKEHRIMCIFDREDILNTVVHEAVHAAWMTLRYCSMVVKPDTGEEPLAYMTAWLADEMMKFLKEDNWGSRVPEPVTEGEA